MFLKTQLRKYAVEWISNRPPDSKSNIHEIYEYLRIDFSNECEAAGSVPSGEPHYTNDVRQAIRDCRLSGIIRKVGQRRDGNWQRTKKPAENSRASGL